MRFFPFTRDGRQTLMYIVTALCAPALTFVLVWAMWVIEYWPGATAAEKLEKFSQLAFCVAAALIIIVIALSCFISIRAVKASIGKDGLSFDASSDGGGE